MRFFNLVLSLLAFFHLNSQQPDGSFPGKADDRFGKLDLFFDQAYKKGDWNGNVLIAENGRIIYQKSFGKADRENGFDLNDETIFELASVSKQFTAMGIMILVKQGRLSFEDSLRKFFPELPYSNITVRNLLNHTSGLPDYMELFGKYWDSTRIATNDDLIALMVKEHPDTLFSPGRKFAYSNTGYALLASIISKVSGNSFGEFLRQNIFEPLGMKRTLVYSRRYEKRKLDNYAYGYVYEAAGNKYVLADDYPPTGSMVFMLDGIHGDGCVNSTVNDLMKWDRALYSDKLVSQAMMDSAFSPGSSLQGKHNYGFGWGLMDSKTYGKVVNHSGGWPGYSTFIERHISFDKLIILLQNNGKRLPAVDEIRRILYRMEAEDLKEVELAEKDMLEYIGEFELAPEFILTISVKDGKLFAQATNQPAFQIFRQKGDLFFLKVVEAKLQFSRDENNKVNAVTLFQMGQEVKGMKIK